MIETGIFCTSDELLEIQEKAAAASLSGMTSARFGPARSSSLWDELQKHIHELALSKGLPEIEGFYGMDTKGQFLKTGEEK